MFGFSWGEIGIIMAVALIAIGPKDLPVAIRTITGFIKKARGMAAEFQSHVDEMMREANVKDVVGEFKELKKATTLNYAMPASLLDREKLLHATPDELNEMMAKAESYTPPAEVVEEQNPAAPRFIPPDAARKPPVPAFFPPGTKRWGF